MTEVKTYCDHCRRELDCMTDYADTEITVLHDLTVDLCKECMNELQGIIEEFVKMDKE